MFIPGVSSASIVSVIASIQLMLKSRFYISESTWWAIYVDVLAAGTPASDFLSVFSVAK